MALGARGQRKPVVLRTTRKPVLRLSSRDLATTAKQIGTFGEELGNLAGEIRRAREGAVEAEGKRSPVEVVLQALTSRR